MVWILMIVNEVVGVLQVSLLSLSHHRLELETDWVLGFGKTFGHIFGISDAILGLTIFAMGNSLGDLVANATVAVCFHSFSRS